MRRLFIVFIVLIGTSPVAEAQNYCLADSDTMEFTSVSSTAMTLDTNGNYSFSFVVDLGFDCPSEPPTINKCFSCVEVKLIRRDCLSLDPPDPNGGMWHEKEYNGPKYTTITLSACATLGTKVRLNFNAKNLTPAKDWDLIIQASEPGQDEDGNYTCSEEGDWGLTPYVMNFTTPHANGTPFTKHCVGGSEQWMLEDVPRAFDALEEMVIPTGAEI